MIGVDIVDIQRIAKLIKKESFLQRIYSSTEIRYCKSKKRSAQHFAVRFAAKEAVWKALSASGVLSTKIKRVGHKDISIANAPDGHPLVVFTPTLKRLEPRIQISLSHTEDYAVAVAIITTEIRK